MGLTVCARCDHEYQDFYFDEDGIEQGVYYCPKCDSCQHCGCCPCYKKGCRWCWPGFHYYKDTMIMGYAPLKEVANKPFNVSTMEYFTPNEIKKKI